MYTSIITQDIQESLNSMGITLEKTPIVSYSKFDNYEYQTPILFELKNKISQEDIQKLIDSLVSTGNYKTVENSNNFLSFIMNKKHLEYTTNKSPKNVVIDYCSVNVAKEMHIGHIRSMFIGDYIARLHAFNGDNVIRQNHLGDYGNQFGFLINFIMKENIDLSNINNKGLTDIYKSAYNLYNEDESFKTSSDLVAKELQNKSNDEIYSIWQKICSISISKLDQVFQDFNILMIEEDIKGESFYANMLPAILDDLIHKEIAIKNEDGSVTVHLNDDEVLVLQKSNGAYLYALFDIACAKYRYEKYQADKILYVVDKRQELHFKQVFSIVKKAKYVSEETELIHISFGTVLNKDKKPLKTKTGESIYLDDVFLLGKEFLNTQEYYINMNEELKSEIINKTIVGGLKFHDLKMSRNQDYIFNFDTMFNFNGASAAYIQNAYVRINSILKMAMTEINHQEFDINCGLYDDIEKSLFFKCQKIEEIILNIEDNDYKSSVLAEAILNLVKSFHQYYETTHILNIDDEEFKKSKLLLLDYIRITILYSCDILGISVYESSK